MNWWGKLIGTGVGMFGVPLVHWRVLRLDICMTKMIPLPRMKERQGFFIWRISFLVQQRFQKQTEEYLPKKFQ